MKIHNFQVVERGERSSIIEITDKHIDILRGWEEFPYTGINDQDFVKYIAELEDYFKEIEGEEDKHLFPDFAKILYDQLFGDELERTECWSSLEKSGDSKLILEDNDGNTLAEAESSM